MNLFKDAQAWIDVRLDAHYQEWVEAQQYTDHNPGATVDDLLGIGIGEAIAEDVIAHARIDPDVPLGKTVL